MPWLTSTSSELQKKEHWIAAATALAITVLLAAGTPHWWSWDDPIILQYASAHPFYSFFVSPGVWRELTFINLTPLLAASFRLDCSLFGFSPIPFHLHQLLLIWISLWLLHHLLRRWLSAGAAILAILSAGLTKPLFECANLLMLRHYVEGLALALTAALLMIRILEAQPGGSQKYIKTALLTTCCALAAAAKEVFVPLPIFLTVLPVASFNKRLKVLAPSYFWLGIYPLWRRWMLGSWVGGYGTAIHLEQLIALPQRLFAAIGLSGWVLVPVLLGTVLALLKQRRYGDLIFVVAAAAIAILPVVPVSAWLVPRYCLVAAVLAGALMGWCFDRIISATVTILRKPIHTRSGEWANNRGSRALFGKSAGIGCLLVVLIQVTLSDGLHWRRAAIADLQQQKVEGEYVLRAGSPNDFIYKPAAQPQFYDGLNEIRVRHLRLGDGPEALFDPVVLLGKADARVLQYVPRLKILKPEPDADRIATDLLRTLRPGKPLEVRIHYRYPRVEWQLGPYVSGQYAFLMGGHSKGLYPVPPSGKMSGFFRHDTEVRVKYSSPEGWVVYSPPLTISIVDQHGEIDWSRPGPQQADRSAPQG